MGAIPFALQLYTVRDHLDKDPAGTLKQVKAIGFDYVELAGFAGRTAEEFNLMLAEAGLRAVSGHVGLEDLEKGGAESLALAQTFSLKYLALSANGKDKAGWLAVAQTLDKAGARLKAAGVQLCYHNHAHEFVRFDGEYALDLLYAHTAPEHLAAQMDVYWVRHGGVDPVSYIQKYAGRCPLLHVKDMTASEPATFAEVGRGIIDMPAVFAAGRQAGTHWYIVEQDVCAGDSLESARISADYMAQQ